MWTMFFILLSAIILSSLPFNDSGPVIIEWFGYHAEISLTLLVIVILLVFTSLFFLTYLFICLKNIPCSLKKHYKDKQNHEDMLLLLDGFSALYRQDINKAKWIMKKLNSDHEQIQKLKPIFLLFCAQCNELLCAEEALEENYQELLHFDELKIFALKGLITIRMKNKCYYDALFYAEKMLSMQPKTNWLLRNLITIYMELGSYDQAQQVIKKSIDYDFIDQNEANQLLLKCYIAMANQSIDRLEISEATSLLEKAYKLDSSSIEVAIMLAKIQDSDKKSAYKILSKAWKKSPSLPIAKAILSLYQDYNINKQIKLIEDLIDMAPQAKEGYLIMAELCLKEEMIPSARAAMDRLLEITVPDQQISKLMAIIEAKAQSNYSAVLNWLNKL